MSSGDEEDNASLNNSFPKLPRGLSITDRKHYLLLISATLAITLVNLQYCDSYSFNYCFNDYFLGRLPFNLPLTLISSAIYAFLVIKAVEEWLNDSDKWVKLSIILATLGVVYIMMVNSTKLRFGGLHTTIAFAVMGVVLVVVLVKRLY